MAQEEVLQQAVNDLAMVRRAIERIHGEQGQASLRSLRSTGDARFALHLIALVTSLALALFNALTQALTSPLLESAHWPREGRLYLLLQVGAILPLLVGAAYFIVWRAARLSDELWSAYVARNFQYLRNLSLIGDLFVKFVVLALLVEARHPEWVAALLTLFIGDYLIQGRFFVLPLQAGLSLGVACLGLAVAQLWLGSSNLVVPLLVFGAVCAASTLYLVLLNRQRQASAAAEGLK